uniref:PH domain-containing protein n=1 Tax=Clastoptera arizonana TaxID=38151 RepID=A0A1B6C3E3_9HEMI
MEGILWKWTNYWNGWQTRWFVIENGILSYYMSQEEVNQGCKGSMKVSALEIILNTVDTSRMDLVIPGEKHIYLKASSSQERQQWLVALGSSKACLTSRHRKESVADCNPDSLKTKKNELRLYCDLLMQQVHMVKTAVGDENKPDLKRLSEGSCLLAATCDTFIKTLEECMKINNSTLSPYEVQENILSISKSKLTTPTVPIMKTNLNGRKT